MNTNTTAPAPNKDLITLTREIYITSKTNKGPAQVYINYNPRNGYYYGILKGDKIAWGHKYFSILFQCEDAARETYGQDCVLTVS